MEGVVCQVILTVCLSLIYLLDHLTASKIVSGHLDHILTPVVDVSPDAYVVSPLV